MKVTFVAFHRAHRAWGTVLPASAGLALWVWSLLLFVDRMHGPIEVYDEGILLTDANLLLMGKAIYRDFYSNYPPGIFLMLAGLWKFTGVAVFAERLCGLVVHVTICTLVGRLAGRLTSRGFLPWPAGLCGMWMVAIAPVPYAYIAALACALLSIELVMRAVASVRGWAWLAPGLAFGCVGCLRHDLFVYMCAGLVPVAAVLGWQSRRALFLTSVRGPTVWTCAGVLAPILTMWVPTLWRAGFSQVFHDLILDQVRFVMPARVLPLPTLWEFVDAPPFPFGLPAWWASPFPAAVALGLAGPLFAGTLIVFSKRLRIQGRLLIALLGALSVAVLPQMMGRTDMWHALSIVGPAFVLVGAIAEAPAWRTGLCWLFSALVLVLPVRDALTIPPPQPETEAVDPRLKRVQGLDPAERALVAFVDANTAVGEPVYVGLTDHRQVFVNEMSLYFLTNRPGATRVMQFDPNVVNREDVQRQMASEIGARARLLVLSSFMVGYSEPQNESVRVGSGYLDQYLQERFELAARFGRYQVWLRREC